MSDDAEFAAFLKGEDALSRQLQAMPQAAPGAALDAAILQRARDMMAQEARPAAANDAGEGTPAPRLGRLSWRWRVPAGIAATVLAGVLANQAFQSSMELESRAGMPAEENAMILAPVPAAEPPAADLQVAPPPKAPMPEYKAPAPVPELQRRAAAAPAAEPMQRVEITGSAPRMRTQSESSMPVTVMESAPVPAAPAPAPMAAASNVAPVVAPSFRNEYTQREAAEERASADKTVKVDVSGSRLKADSAARQAAVWLAEIEAMLGTGKDTETLESWSRFRQAYPDYPVPEATSDRIKAIQK